MTWLVLLAACGRGPELSAVAPAEVHPGDPVKVAGDRFAVGDVLALRLPGDAVTYPLLDAVVTPPGLAEGTVPAEVQPGTYDLVITRGAAEVVLASALDVTADPDELPCSPEFTANTELSLARKEVVIDRFYRTGDRETVHLAMSDIARVEYERIALPDGSRCSAIFMRTTEGRRVVFIDDATIDLKDRATRLAHDMGKELEITRDDAAATAPEPDEE